MTSAKPQLVTPQVMPQSQAGLRAAVRCWHVREWPLNDQAAWAAGLVVGDPFDDPTYSENLSAPTVGKVRKGYGRWLDFLERHELLDHAEPPLARVTRRRIVRYLHDLKSAGNADATLIGRIVELTMALKILVPGAKVDWIKRPTGPTIYAALPKIQRHLFVPDTGVLVAKALDKMNELDPGSVDRRYALVAFRDAVLVAVFATRARRLRAMAGIRVGKELIWRDDRFWIDLPPELVKTKKPDSFSLPAVLTPYVQRYLHEVRPALLNGHRSDGMWIGIGGEMLGYKGVQQSFTRTTGRWFEVGFGPHRCRHAATTTAALQMPEVPGLGARMLGSSEQVVEKHYQRAGQVVAALKLDQLIERQLKALRAGSGSS